MATEEDIAAGLINWVNSLEVADPISTIDHLTDGAVIWKVLRGYLVWSDSSDTDQLQNG
jgi:hypothetical protein